MSTRGGEVERADGGKSVFSTHEVARVCSVTPMTVIRWIEDGKLPAFKTVGGHRRVKGGDLVQFCRARGIPAPDGASAVLVVDSDPARRRATASSLRAALAGVSIVEASGADEARRAVAKRRPTLVVVGHVDGNGVVEVVRETLGVTAGLMSEK